MIETAQVASLSQDGQCVDWAYPWDRSQQLIVRRSLSSSPRGLRSDCAVRSGRALHQEPSGTYQQRLNPADRQAYRVSAVSIDIRKQTFFCDFAPDNIPSSAMNASYPSLRSSAVTVTFQKSKEPISTGTAVKAVASDNTGQIMRQMRCHSSVFELERCHGLGSSCSHSSLTMDRGRTVFPISIMCKMT